MSLNASRVMALLCAASLPVCATVYHLDPGGTDSPSGGTSGSPWKTFTYACQRLTAGDTLTVHDGLYCERPVSINSISGTSQRPIVVMAAAGASPVVDMGLVPQNWQVHSGSVYKATLTYTGRDAADQVRAVVVEGKPLIGTATLGEMTEGSYVVDATTLYVWAFGGVDPASRPVTVTCDNPDIDNRPGFKLYRCNNWEFHGLTVQGGHAGFWSDDWSGGRSSGLSVYDCTIRYNTTCAVYVYNYDDLVVSGCDIYQNGLINWPRRSLKNWVK